jgi:hypothetical protein
MMFLQSRALSVSAKMTITDVTENGGSISYILIHAVKYIGFEKGKREQDAHSTTSCLWKSLKGIVAVLTARHFLNKNTF